MHRGQLSLPVIEAGIGIVFVLAILAGFTLGVPAPDTETPQLDSYAADTAAILASEPPRHEGQSRLAEVAQSEEAFDRERDALEARVDRILPDNLMYRIETPHGTVGYVRPTDTSAGRTTVLTVGGEVTIWIWYV